MYGAIWGDMIGSPYEFDQGNKSKDFPLFSEEAMFTDDTVMTIAVAEAFLDAQGVAEFNKVDFMHLSRKGHMQLADKLAELIPALMEKV